MEFTSADCNVNTFPEWTFYCIGVLFLCEKGTVFACIVCICLICNVFLIEGGVKAV